MEGVDWWWWWWCLHHPNNGCGSPHGRGEMLWLSLLLGPLLLEEPSETAPPGTSIIFIFVGCCFAKQGPHGGTSSPDGSCCCQQVASWLANCRNFKRACRAVLCRAVLCRAVPCCAVLCRAVDCTGLHWTALDWTTRRTTPSFGRTDRQ